MSFNHPRRIDFFEGQVIQLRSLVSGNFVWACPKGASVDGNGLKNMRSAWRVSVIGTEEITLRSVKNPERYFSLSDGRFYQGIVPVVLKWTMIDLKNNIFIFSPRDSEEALGMKRYGQVGCIRLFPMNLNGVEIKFEVNSVQFDDVRKEKIEEEDPKQRRYNFLRKVEGAEPRYLQEKDISILEQGETMYYKKKANKVHSYKSIPQNNLRKNDLCVLDRLYHPLIDIERVSSDAAISFVEKVNENVKKGNSLFVFENDHINGFFNSRYAKKKLPTKILESTLPENCYRFFASYFLRRNDFPQNLERMKFGSLVPKTYDRSYLYKDENNDDKVPYRSRKFEYPWNIGGDENFFSAGKVYYVGNEDVDEVRDATGETHEYLLICFADSKRNVARIKSSVGKLAKLEVFSLAQTRKILDGERKRKGFWIVQL